jgi:hypothetical protein
MTVNSTVKYYRVAELEKEREWQPIESFDKDAEGFNCFVLFKDPIDSKKGIFHAGYYHDNGVYPAGFRYWHDASVIRNPTHWQPLQQPPKESEQCLNQAN